MPLKWNGVASLLAANLLICAVQTALGSISVLYALCLLCVLSIIQLLGALLFCVTVLGHQDIEDALTPGGVAWLTVLAWPWHPFKAWGGKMLLYGMSAMGSSTSGVATLLLLLGGIALGVYCRRRKLAMAAPPPPQRPRHQVIDRNVDPRNIINQKRGAAYSLRSRAQ